MPQSTTPAQPRSRLHDLWKTRALSRCWATRPSPFFDIKPSMVPSKSASDRPWCRLKWTIINVNNANKATSNRGIKYNQLVAVVDCGGAGIRHLPASKYITPVTKIALICRWKIPKAPSSAALPNMIKQTSEQDIERFCIPVGKRIMNYHENLWNSNFELTEWRSSRYWIFNVGRIVFHVVVSTVFHIFGQVIDTFRSVWKSKAAQLTHLVLTQIDAQCPNATVHRHQKNILPISMAYTQTHSSWLVHKSISLNDITYVWLASGRPVRSDANAVRVAYCSSI